MVQKTTAVSLLVIACGLLAGCTKSVLPGSGRGICFVTSSESLRTRTAYSDYEETISGTTKKAVRIDWTQGDEFKVWSNYATHIQSSSIHTADYIVQQATSDGLRSRATVDPSDHNGLQWGTTTNDYTFYASYPADKSSFSADGTKTKMTGTLPYDQTWGSSIPVGGIDMQYAYMFASATAAYNASEVELDFYPMFTVFQFTVGLGKNTKVTLASFELSSSSQAVTGPFKIVGEDFLVANPPAAVSALPVTTSDNPQKITVDLNDAVLDSTHPTITVTVVALPMDLTDLSITFVGNDTKYSDDDDIGTRTLDLNYGDSPSASGAVAHSPITFAGCRKYILKDFSFPQVIKEDEDDSHNEDILWDVEGKIEVLYWD